MAKSNKQILQEETILGEKAAKLTTNYVLAKIKSSSLNMRGIGSPYLKGAKKENERRALLDATWIEPEMGEHRLLGFKFISNRVGFVHHFGTVRDKTKFIQTHGKTGTVFEKSNGFLKSQPFFDDVYKNSGALAVLEEGLSKTRIRAITIELQNMVFKIDSQNG